MSQIDNLYKITVMRDNNWEMKKLMPNQQGFIPMMICIILVVAVVIYLCFKVVARAQH